MTDNPLLGGVAPPGNLGGSATASWRTDFDNARDPYSARVALGMGNSPLVPAAPSAFTTGDLKPTHKTVADSGWILWSDGTIGDASSGSSIRANADTSALFTLYYNSYSDAQCPLLTSGGGATTRGAQGTAAAAFAAHCRMTLPKGASRSLALAGAGAGLTSRTVGDSAGAETETPTTAKTAAHTHATVLNPATFQTTAFQAGTDANLETGNPGTTASTGSGTALNILDPSAYINVMVKL